MNKPFKYDTYHAQTIFVYKGEACCDNVYQIANQNDDPPPTGPLDYEGNKEL